MAIIISQVFSQNTAHMRVGRHGRRTAPLWGSKCMVTGTQGDDLIIPCEVRATNKEPQTMLIPQVDFSEAGKRTVSKLRVSVHVSPVSQEAAKLPSKQKQALTRFFFHIFFFRHL